VLRGSGGRTDESHRRIIDVKVSDADHVEVERERRLAKVADRLFEGEEAVIR
jgi:hypothetical protein